MSTLLLPTFYVLAGFSLMILGSDRLIKGSIDIANRLKLPKVFVGAVLVGFGTSMPEFFTSMYSAYVGEGVLAAGNVIGSNIFNSTLILGTCLLFPFALAPSEKSFITTLFIVLPGALAVLFLHDLQLYFWEGLLLLVPMPFFIFHVLKQPLTEDVEADPNSNLFISFLWGTLGVILLYFGSTLSIDGSLKVSSLLGLSKDFAGTIILAVGTCLPELVTTLVAGFKKEISLAFSNIIGSNALNGFFVLGLSSTLFPFSVDAKTAFFNAPFLLGVSLFIPLVVYIQNKVFVKIFAALLFIAYGVFLHSTL